MSVFPTICFRRQRIQYKIQQLLYPKVFNDDLSKSFGFDHSDMNRNNGSFNCDLKKGMDILEKTLKTTWGTIFQR